MLRFSKTLSDLLSDGERNTTPLPSPSSVLSQFDGYCIFIPNVELFSYVRKGLLLGIVFVGAILVFDGRAAVYIIETAAVRRNIGSMNKYRKRGGKRPVKDLVFLIIYYPSMNIGHS